MTIVRTPMGFVIAPVRDGKLVEPDEFNAWPEADQKAAQDTIAALQNELEQSEWLRLLPYNEKFAAAADASLARMATNRECRAASLPWHLPVLWPVSAWQAPA